MEINSQVALALQYVESTDVSLFLTGKAGTGKTTFLHYVVEHTHKRHVVLAPTGVAAINAGGVTIHSFFQLPFDPYLPDVPELKTEYQVPQGRHKLRKEKLSLIRSLDLLIIDEISMVRADLLDAVDATLQRVRRNSRPFGGVQLLMIGDVQQLPPVVTDEERPYLERVYPSPFFFHSKALQRIDYITIELTTVYRQKSADFVRLLNNIRDNHFDPATLQLLNSRYDASFDPPDSEHYIRLTTHNYQANRINNSKMERLTTPLITLQAQIDGNFPESSAPTSVTLHLKIGAQVMFVRNDSPGHRYYNGKIGVVKDYDAEAATVTVVDEQGQAIEVKRDRWENVRYKLSPQTNDIISEVEGTFTQYPLRLAWAVTIHKAQGLTFDRVIIDAGSAFTYGQVYVALSRCRTLEGLVLSTPITAACSHADTDVQHFVDTFPSREQVTTQLDAFRNEYYLRLVYELFDVTPLRHAADRLTTLFFRHLLSLYPTQCQQLSDITRSVLPQLGAVTDRFRRVLTSMAQGSTDLQHRADIQERILSAAAYYEEHLHTIEQQVTPMLQVGVSDKTVGKNLKEDAEAFTAALGQQLACLRAVRQQGFSIEVYQKARTDYLLRDATADRTTPPRQRQRAQAVYSDVAHPDLIPMLTRWRQETAGANDVPPYQVMTQKVLLAIADSLPTSRAALQRISGIGPAFMTRYAADVLEIIENYCRHHGIDITAEPTVAATPPSKTNHTNPATDEVRRQAMALFAEGVAIDDIADRVGRAPSTVEGYLIDGLKNGKLDIEMFLDADEQDVLVAYFLEVEPDHKLSQAYDNFNGDFSYLKLRAARFFANTLRES